MTLIFTFTHRCEYWLFLLGTYKDSITVLMKIHKISGVFANISNRASNKSFKTFEEAVAARKEAEDKYFGEFSYDNSMKLKTS